MKLAICIPTHHGRAAYLEQLLQSVLEQQGPLSGDLIEICISDNASADGTSELIERYQRSSHLPVKYFRFDVDMRGVRNFVNVIDMARAEYCWLVGSDDILLPGAISTVLRLLDTQPDIAGLTVNKLNFDRSLSSFVGVDHQIVLPSEPSRTRLLTSFDEVMANLGMLFTYMSAHVFRRADWQSVVRAFGIEHLVTLRHFPHSFVFAHIAKAADNWYWLADFLMIQRLDNSCVMEEAGNQQSIFATEMTEDLVRVYRSMLDERLPVFSSLMRRWFVIYWNPWRIMNYRSWPAISPREQRAMFHQCVHWFHRVPLFWMTSYPLLVVPAPIIRWAKRAIDRLYGPTESDNPERWLGPAGRAAFRLVLRALRIERRGDWRSDAGAAAATEYLQRWHGSASRR